MRSSDRAGLCDLLASLDNVSKRALFEVGRALHRADEIWDKVRSTFIDVLNICPASVHLLFKADKSVVCAATADKDKYYQSSKYSEDS